MNKELFRPVVRATVALFLIVLVKFVAMQILRGIEPAYSVIDIAISFGVIVVLLKFRQEFNRQLGISSPSFPEAQSIVSGIVLLLAVLTLYSAFAPYAYLLPYGLYYVIFFVLALVPVYLLWNILYKHSDRMSDFFSLLVAEEKIVCSCGRENLASSKYCNRCGLALQKPERT